MIKIIIADDSELFRNIFKEKIESSGKIEVIALARNGQEAITLVKEMKPDLLVLDCEMPVMNGLECLQKIQHEYPLPVFMLSSLTSEGAEVTIKALEYGAVDFLQKPTDGVDGLTRVMGALIEKIEVIILQKRLRGIRDKYKPVNLQKEVLLPEKKIKTRDVDLVAIGSSTGGIQSARDIIPQLPSNMTPVVWVQHMPQGFTESLAKRFNVISNIRVKLAEDKEVIGQGTCYLAPAGFQMRVERLLDKTRLRVQGQERVSSHCPSCNVLFGSVAEHYTQNAIGVVLSGMGDDGAVGLEKMHRKGAFIIGQTEESCVVYGMPKMAKERGAVDVELNSKDIADVVQRISGFKP